MKTKFLKGQKIPMLDESRPIITVDTLVKHCNKCDNDKALNEFNLDRRNKRDGRKYQCRSCEIKQRRNFIDKKQQEYVDNVRNTEWYKNYLLEKNKRTRNKQGNPNTKFWDKMKYRNKKTAMLSASKI